MDTYFAQQEKIRKAIELAGGSVEVVRDPKEPDMWHAPEGKKYAYIASVSLKKVKIEKIVFENISHLKKLRTIFLDGSSFAESNVKLLSKCDQLKACFLTNGPLTDLGMEYIGYIESLISLSLDSNHFTDEGTRHLGRLKNLKSIDMDNVGITSSGTTFFANLRHLQSICMENTNISDDSIGHLKASKDELCYIDFSGTKLTPKGIASMLEFQSLLSLTLNRLPVDDDFAKELWRLDYLEEIDLCDTLITDQGISWMAGMESIRELYLDGTNITNKSIDSFTQFPSLDTLSIKRTKITPAGLKTLEELLTNVLIFKDRIG